MPNRVVVAPVEPRGHPEPEERKNVPLQRLAMRGAGL